MTLDAIILSDSGTTSFSATNPLKLTIDGRVADIQVVRNYVENEGTLVEPVEGDGTMSWSSAPKLNGIFLFNYLTRHHFNVELINTYYEEKEKFRRLLKQNPKAVVISTTFISDKDALRQVVADIRNVAPDIFIVVGGHFIYLSYLMLQRSREGDYDTDSGKQQYLFLDSCNEPDVDLYIVSLRGEEILREALHRTTRNRRMDDIPNTARLTGNTYGFSKRIDDISGVENLPIDWASLPEAVFRSGVVSLQASTGCTFNCAFCNFTKDRRMNRVKPLDRIVTEMKAVSDRGAKYIWFVDDNFRLGKNDLNRVCRRFIDEGFGLKWMTFIRASMLKDQDAALLKQAGCLEVQLGLESAALRILRNMNKKADPALYDAVLRKLRSAGINCSCYFIFGFPGETGDTVRQTRAFIRAHGQMDVEGSLSCSFFPFILSPLSPIYEPVARKKYGLSGYMNTWEHRSMNSENARQEIIKTFLDAQTPGPIYRGDNQDMLRDLGPLRRKKFHATRHALAKAAFQGKLEKSMIVDSFQDVFPAEI